MVWKIMATLITLGQTLIVCFVYINVLIRTLCSNYPHFYKWITGLVFGRNTIKNRDCQSHSQANVFPVFSVAGTLLCFDCFICKAKVLM